MGVVMEDEFRKCSCCTECKDMFKVCAIRPNQKYAMGHGPKPFSIETPCGCKCGGIILNPNADGKIRNFIKGHNARMDTERRVKQINKNRMDNRDKLDAARQTDVYKEHMSESQKERWAEMKENAPEKAKEILDKLHVGRAMVGNGPETRRKLSEAVKRYIKERPEEFAAARAKANKTNTGRPRSLEFIKTMTKILQSQERRDIISKTHKGKPKSESMKRKLSDLWNDMTYAEKTKRSQASGNGEHEPSIPELLFFDLFQINDIPLKYGGYDLFNIHGFVPDFINEEKKVIVECYGYHHYTKLDVMERDARRRIAYAKAGYTLLEFWSYNIQDERGHAHERLSDNFIVDKVRNALEINSDLSPKLTLIFG